MELLYYIDMTEEYYAETKVKFPVVEIDLHQQFLFRLGKATGELGIGPVNLEIFDQSAKMDRRRVFLAFESSEDAMAFKLKWT